MIPTLFARLSLDGLAHRVSKGDLGIDEALSRAYLIGAKDLELQLQIDLARTRAKELTNATPRTDPSARVTDTQQSTTP